MNPIAAYEGPLTVDLIYKYLDEIRRLHVEKPDYLFLTWKGKRELYAQPQAAQYISIGSFDLFMGMHVVVAPKLPENTLLIGTLEIATTPRMALREKLTRDQIEAIGEQAIQALKRKHIELDWDEA